MNDAELKAMDQEMIARNAEANLQLAGGENPDSTAMAFAKARELGVPFQWARELDNSKLWTPRKVDGLHPELQRMLALDVDRVPLYRDSLPELDNAIHKIEAAGMSVEDRYRAVQRLYDERGVPYPKRVALSQAGFQANPGGGFSKDGVPAGNPIAPQDIIDGPEEQALIARALEKMQKAKGFDVQDLDQFFLLSEGGRRKLLSSFISRVEKENAAIRQLNYDYPEGWIKLADAEIQERLARISEQRGVDLSDIAIDRLRKGGLGEADYAEAINILGLRDIYKLVTKKSPEELAAINAESSTEDLLSKLKYLEEESLGLRGRTIAGQVATGVSTMISYMVELAATAGLATPATGARMGLGAAVKGALKAGGFTGVKAASKALFTKGGLKALGNAVGMIALGEAKRLPAFAPKIAAQALNEWERGPVTYLGEGGLETVIPEQRVDELVTLLTRNAIQTYLGNVSEWGGEFLPNDDLLKLVPKKYRTALVKQFISDISGDATKSRVFQSAISDNVPLEGVLGEIAEEWVNNAFERVSTLVGQATGVEALNMERESVFGDAEENAVIALTSVIGSTGGKMARVPAAMEHYRKLARFVDTHRGMVDAMTHVVEKIPGGADEADVFMQRARKGDAKMFIDPDDAALFLETYPEFAQKVKITEDAIAEAKAKGRLVTVSQNAVILEQAKGGANAQVGEELVSLTQDAGITAQEALTADNADEAIEAFREERERVQKYQVKIQSAVETAARSAGISASAQKAFSTVASFMVNYLSSHSTDEALVDQALDRLVFKFQENPEGFSPAMALQEAFHGTPHTWAPEPGFPYGRPRLDKIGTGEGSQAFGHGIYFAEAKGVADYYKPVATRESALVRSIYKAGIESSKEPFVHLTSDELRHITRSLVTDGTPREQILSDYEKRYQHEPMDEYKALMSLVSGVLDFLEARIAEGILEEAPSLYRLDIPDEDIPRMLLWDVPVDEQLERLPRLAEAIARAYKDVGDLSEEALAWAETSIQNAKGLLVPKSYTGSLREYFETKQDGWRESAIHVGRLARKSGIDTPIPYDLSTVSGGKLYAQLEDVFSSRSAASAYLQSLGIPGLKYLDANSRAGSDNPTYNYVIWDQDVLDRIALLERNGSELVRMSALAQNVPPEVAEMDVEYMDAVASYDVDRQMELVEKAAKMAGYTLGPVYHWGYFDKRQGVPNTPMHLGTEDAARERAFGKAQEEEADLVEAYEGDDGRWHWDDGRGITSEDMGEEGYETEEEAVEAGREYVFDNLNLDDMDPEDSGNFTEAYIRLDNMYRSPDVVGKNGEWDRVVEKAKKAGYDGIVYRNQFEDAGSDSFIAFYPNQIKLADPIVKDEMGNIIPLSRRFDFTKADVRYQEAVSAIDRRYAEALEKGDEAAMAEVVERAARMAGYDTQPLYHGTVEEFTVFDLEKAGQRDAGDWGKGFYFTPERMWADAYAGQSPKARVMSVYLRLRKPFVINLPEGAPGHYKVTAAETGIYEILDSVGFDYTTVTRQGKPVPVFGTSKGGEGWSGNTKETMPLFDFIRRIGAEAFREALIKAGYDGVINTETQERVAFYPNQIKSADPIVRDDQGRVIPPSRRFDLTNADVRYQEVYHGTPHAWAPEPGFPNGRPRIDKFSTGYGMGAQGRGWYSAEDSWVASHYRGSESQEGEAGYLYKLDIPDQDIPRMLLWDKPLSEQPDGIPQDVLSELWETAYGPPGDLTDDASAWIEGRYPEAAEKIRNKGRNWQRSLYNLAMRYSSETGRETPLPRYLAEYITGEDIYTQLCYALGGHVQATEYLTSKGIPGNKYLDSPSAWGSGDPSYNYVIWDQDVLDRIALLERNGEAVSAISKLYQGIDPSIEALDAEYLEAVKNGDMETVTRLVTEAAEKSGLNIIQDTPAYAVRRKAPPKKTVKAYKLFRMKKKAPGELFPLFVGASVPVPTGVWLDAVAGPRGEDTKGGKARVKSTLGPLAYRPGWHAGDLPYASHIGAKNKDGAVWARQDYEVWAEVEMAADVDYQPEATRNGTRPDGRLVEGDAQINYLPEDGLYRYKTNANMTGKWIISGSAKVNRILTEAEVNEILEKEGITPMPWKSGPLDVSAYGVKTGDVPTGVNKVIDPITYDDKGQVIPLSQRFRRDNPDARYQREAAIKGSITFGSDFRQSFDAVVTLFKEGADASTLPHESAHWLKRMMEAMVASEVADDTLKEDYQTIERWLDRQVYEAEPGTQSYQIEREEKFARGFEEYFRTGKAPTAEVSSAFGTLKRYLVAIYRYVTSLRVQLDDEIISVFDRILSTESLLERESPLKEAADALRDTYKELLGLSQDEAKEFIDLIRKANDQMAENLDSKKARMLGKLKTKWAAEARQAMEGMRVYRAWQALKKDGGLDYAFIATNPSYGKEIADVFHGNGLTGKKRSPGRDVPTFAEEQGYSSVDEMLGELFSAQTPQEFTKAYQAQREKAWNDEMELDEDTLSVQASIDTLDKVAELLAVKGGKEGYRVRRQALKNQVAAEIDAMQVKEITSDTALVNDCKSASKKLVKAINDKDYVTALEVASGLRYNLELMRGKADARKRVSQTKALFRKVSAAKKGALFGDYHNALRELALYFGFSQKQLRWDDNFRRLVAAEEADELFGEARTWSDFLYAENVVAFKNLSYSQFSELGDFADYLYGWGRDLVLARRGTFAERVARRIEACCSVMDELPKKYHDRGHETPSLLRGARRFMNLGTNLNTFLGRADSFRHKGGEGRRGPNMELRDKLVIAFGDMIRLENEAKMPAKLAIEALAKSAKAMDMSGLPAFTGTGLLHGYSKWTPEMVIAACLNMGTASNRQRLRDGYGWEDADLDAIASKLTASDWAAIQQVWDALSGELQRAVEATFLEENHYRLRLIPPQEFDVRTADGSTITVRGGYYPIKYVHRSKGKDLVLGFQTKGLYDDVSSLHARHENIKEPDPVRLSLQIPLAHIHEAAQYAATRMVCREVLGVVRSEDYRNAFGQTQSFESYEMMLDLLKNIANPDKATEGILDGFEAWARTTLTATALMGNVRSVVMQLSSATVGMDELGGFYAESLAEFATSPVDTLAMVRAKSSMMRHRADYFDIDLKSAVDSLVDGPGQKVRKGFAKGGYFMMRWMDTLVASVGWRAKYDQAWSSLLQQGEDPSTIEHRAVAMADDFIARTQGAARTLDLSPIQLDHLGRLLSPFITSTNAHYNTMLETLGAVKNGRLSAGEALLALSGNFVAPTLFSAVIGWIIAGGVVGDDDDAIDEANKAFIRELLSAPFSGIPLVRDFADLTATLTADKLKGDSVSLYGKNLLDVGALGAVEDIFKALYAGGDAASEGDWSRAAWQWSDALGSALHVPAIRIYTRAKKLYLANDGELPDVLEDLDDAVKAKGK